MTRITCLPGGLCLLSLICLGQTPTGEVRGRVVDPSQSVIGAAKVEITNAKTNVTLSTTANEVGNFLIRNLNPGLYKLDVTASGFKRYTRERLEVRVGDVLDLTVAMEVGAASESVTVTAETPLLETANAGVGHVIDTRRLLDLPTPGNSAIYMLQFTPGATTSTPPTNLWPPDALGSGSTTTIGGGRAGQNEFTIDGTPMMTRAGGFTMNPPQEMVQEIRVTTAGYDASMGRFSGGQVTMVMKSGGNALHGSALYQNLSRGLMAHDLFTNNFINNPATGPVTSEKIEQAWPPQRVTLFAAPGGSAVQGLGSETPFSMNRKRAVARTAAPLERLLALDQPPATPAVTLSRARFRNCRIEALEFAAAPGVWIPAWLYLPRQEGAVKSVAVLLEPGGRPAWREGELYDQLAAQGCAICAPDLRGIGDLTPEYGRHAARNAREHANDEMWAWSSLVFGKPLAGQRVTDLLAVVRGLRGRAELKDKRLTVAARGTMSPPALFAAALERKIDALYLSGGLVSFQSVVETEDYNHPFGNFVPNLLLHTDLPELAASLAPRRAVLAGAVDGAGRRMPVEAVRREYGAANIEVRAEARWDAESILRV